MRALVLSAFVVGCAVAEPMAVQRINIVPVGKASRRTQYSDRATRSHSIGVQRFALSRKRVDRYETGLLAAVTDEPEAADVRLRWNDYVLVFSEALGDDARHKVHVSGTLRSALADFAKRSMSVRFLETVNDLIDDGGCGFWDAILDAKTSKLESFECHGEG